MAAEYIALDQTVSLNNPIVFDASIPCNKGIVIHEDGTGIFILRGIVNNPCARYAQYRVTFNGNAAIPTGGTVAPIAVSLTVNGEIRSSSKAIYTPAAVEEFGNLTSTAIIKVPRGCCFNLAVRYVAANTTDTPPVAIEVANGNLVVDHIA